MMDDVDTIFEAAGGEAGLRRLAEAWHTRVMADEVVSHAFSHGFRPDHTARLAAYWAEALGGPATFTGVLGEESDVVRIHSGNGEHDEMNERAVACFDAALEDVGYAADSPVARTLHDYFAWATWNSMYAFHESAGDVPPGLSMPHWTWSGRARTPTGE